MSPLVNEILTRAGFWGKMGMDPLAATQSLASALVAAETDDLDQIEAGRVVGDEIDDPKRPLLAKGPVYSVNSSQGNGGAGQGYGSADTASAGQTRAQGSIQYHDHS